MVDKLNNNQVGLIVGIFFALTHALWAILVALVPVLLQQFLDWMYVLHSLKPIWVITSFDLMNAILLIVMTFVIGYALGWVFAAIWNWSKRSKK
jgi:hypothetical protein